MTGAPDVLLVAREDLQVDATRQPVRVPRETQGFIVQYALGVHHLVTVIRKGYHADQFDAETLVVLAQLESHLESKDALDVRE